MSFLQKTRDLRVIESSSDAQLDWSSSCSLRKALWLLEVVPGGPFDLSTSGLSRVGLGFINLPFVDFVSRVAF